MRHIVILKGNPNQTILTGKGQLCYSCITQGGGDDTCLLNPAAVTGGVVRCKYDYCTIRRLANPDAPGNMKFRTK